MAARKKTAKTAASNPPNGNGIWKEFLEIFGRHWKNEDAIENFKKLLEKAKEQKDEIGGVIEARLVAYDGKHDEAVALLEPLTAGSTAITCFALLMRGRIYCNDSENYEASLKDYETLENLIAKEGQKIFSAGLYDLACILTSCLKGYCLIQMGRTEDAIRIFDEIITSFGEHEDGAVIEQVAWAFVNKAGALGNLDRSLEAIAVYDDVLTRLGDAKETPLAEQMAWALVNKGVALGKLDRKDEEIKVYDEVVASFGDCKETALAAQVAWALAFKASVLKCIDQCLEAIAVYDEVVTRFGDRKEIPLAERVASALVNKGLTLGKLDRSLEEIEVYDEVVTRFGDTKETLLAVQVANALVYKGVTLGQLDRSLEEIEVYDEVLTRFGDTKETPLAEHLARALLNKGAALGKLDRKEDAVDVYGYLVDKFGAEEKMPIAGHVADALLCKAVNLNELDRKDEAIKVFNYLFSKFGDRKEVQLETPVAFALISQIIALIKLDRKDEAINKADTILEKFSQKQEYVLKQITILALLTKGMALKTKKSPEPENALEQFEKSLERVDYKNSKNEKKLFVAAITGKLVCLLGIDRNTEACELICNIPEYFNDEEIETEKNWSSFFVDVAKCIGTLPLEVNSDKLDNVVTLCRKSTEGDKTARIAVELALSMRHFDKNRREVFFNKMKKAKEATDKFLTDDSNFKPDMSFLMVLREWNSYTPALPSQEEADRGGGYYFQHDGEGVVIDPGYDFIDNFAKAGGRMRDIRHIVITHAHDDHTAEFESLLMMAERRWKEWKEHKESQKKSKKNPDEAKRQHRLNLYLSASVQRKFAGILDNKKLMLDRVVPLCPPVNGESQEVFINEKTKLSVLPAYHDDVISTNQAVGLCFDFTLSNCKDCRRIIFTGDTGLYPKKLDENGEPEQYDYTDDNGETRKEDELDSGEGKALYEQYINTLGKLEPDLLVAHIGSIKPKEFTCNEVDFEGTEIKNDLVRRFYVNHLGLLGTLVLLYEVKPKAAIISEFGAEMKKFRIELVKHLEEALKEMHKADGGDGESTFVLPGDITIIYNIDEDCFLCHEDLEFKKSSELKVLPWKDIDPKTKSPKNIESNNDFKRVYLYKRDFKLDVPKIDEKLDEDIIMFFRRYYESRLKIHVFGD